MCKFSNEKRKISIKNYKICDNIFICFPNIKKNNMIYLLCYALRSYSWNVTVQRLIL